MHHLLRVTPHEIALLARRMIGAAGRGAPVPLPSRAHRITSRCLGTVVTAVQVTVVAVRAQEELLTAYPAGHRPQPSRRLNVARVGPILYTAGRRRKFMARRHPKTHTKTLQQRQTERHLADAQDRAIVEDIARKY
jgi:hypothetical protein